MIKDNTKVNIKGTAENGTVLKSELKRFAHVNNGKQIRVYTVLLDNGNTFEYDITDLKTI